MQRQENTCKSIRYGGGRSHERTRLRLRSFPVQRENRAKFAKLDLKVGWHLDFRDSNSIAYHKNSLRAKAGKMFG
jgi:hypothetical protein